VHPRKKTDRRRHGRGGGGREIFHGDAGMDHGDARGVEAQALAYQVAEIAADRDEVVHLGGALREQVPRGLAIGPGEIVEERRLALQRADDRTMKFRLEPARHAGEQRVRGGRSHPAAAAGAATRRGGRVRRPAGRARRAASRAWTRRGRARWSCG